MVHVTLLPHSISWVLLLFSFFVRSGELEAMQNDGFFYLNWFSVISSSFPLIFWKWARFTSWNILIYKNDWPIWIYVDSLITDSLVVVIHPISKPYAFWLELDICCAGPVGLRIFFQDLICFTGVWCCGLSLFLSTMNLNFGHAWGLMVPGTHASQLLHT